MNPIFTRSLGALLRPAPKTEAGTRYGKPTDAAAVLRTCLLEKVFGIIRISEENES